MKSKIFLACILLCTIIKAQTNYVLNFDGNSDHVNLGSNVGSNIRSIEFWFNPTVNITPSISQTNVFVGRNDATQLNEYGFFVEGQEYPVADRGKITFYLSDNGSYYYVSSNSNSWTAGTWYHVCGTIDAANGMKLYINGVLQTDTDPYSLAIPAANEITSLGKWGDLSMRYYSGKMDELRFWNRTLSQSEIQQKMCTYLNPSNETGLTGYWKMDEGSGITIFDATTNANNGTITGAVFMQQNNCISGTIAIKDVAVQSTITIFPNPFSSTTTLRTEKVFKDAILMIYNSLGQMVKQIQNISGQEIILNCEDLPNGVYFFCITNEGVSTTKTIVIN